MEIVIPKIFNRYLKNRRATLLAVGPMSKNCVEATIEIANEKNVPIMMIASRRQIDSKEFGGGYVNNWDINIRFRFFGNIHIRNSARYEY